MNYFYLYPSYMYHLYIIKYKYYYIKDPWHVLVINIASMADSEYKTVHFQSNISFINTNVTIIGIIHWIIIFVIIDCIYPFTSSCQMAKVLQKGNGSTRTRQAGPWQPCKSRWTLLRLIVYMYWMKSMLFLLNAKLWSGDHISLMDYK